MAKTAEQVEQKPETRENAPKTIEELVTTLAKRPLVNVTKKYSITLQDPPVSLVDAVQSNLGEKWTVAWSRKRPGEGKAVLTIASK
jgi:hypothetical protein